ncbi:MAG: hypothetical protein RSD81_14640 [Pseudomonas sp.]
MDLNINPDVVDGQMAGGNSTGNKNADAAGKQASAFIKAAIRA